MHQARTSSASRFASFARRILTPLAAVLISAVLPSIAGAGLHDQFTFVGNAGTHQYYVSNDVMSWNDAKALCSTIPGAHLATIGSQEENDFVAGCDVAGTHTGLWIGLKEAAGEGSWQWEDGTVFAYTHWEAGQPDGGANETVVSIKPSHMPNGPGLWHDQNATNVLLPCVLEMAGAMNGFGYVGEYGGCSYYLSNNVMTWNQAYAVIGSIPGGEMATILNAATNDFVAHCDVAEVYTGLWIGLTDEGHEGTWTWTNGGPAIYTNWDAGQPDDNSPPENVASIKPAHMSNGGGHWHDQNANGVLLPTVMVMCPSVPARTRTWGELKAIYR